jgi:ribonuclease PH
MTRVDGRGPEEMRNVSIQGEVNPYAEGSAEVEFGKTKVLITASIEKDVPDWMKEKGTGWITAEYGMLPRSTHSRNKRESASGKQSGRTLEIQRLIGRSLRQAIDLDTLGPVSIRIDCDVLVADGGTRTAAISGAWVALKCALEKGVTLGLVNPGYELYQVAAVSVGTVNGVQLLDLCYEEDSKADFDLNLVYRGDGKVIEIQGCGEKAPLELEGVVALSKLAFTGCGHIFDVQRKVFSSRT